MTEMKNICATLALTAASLLPGIAMAIEEPAYEVLSESPDYQLRRYAPLVVAEMDVDGSFEGAGNDAFRPLAAFINGANTGAVKIGMTAPVTQRRGTENETARESSSTGEKIGMTAPVTQRVTAEGRYVVQFIMPTRYTLDTVPRPTDDRIRLRSEPGRVVAVHRYSGTWSEERYRDRLSALESAIARDGLQVTGDPVWARFNSPFALWFLRRNEIWIPVEG